MLFADQRRRALPGGSALPESSPAYLTSGQLPSLIGRKAFSAGTVATTLRKSQSPFDSDGFLPSSRYIGCSLRPSARMEPLPNRGSSVGIAFIAATTALPSLADPTLSTALR